jgi:hypothetical protein
MKGEEPMSDIAASLRAVDSDADSGRFVAYLDAQSSNWFWQLLKRGSTDTLRLKSGSRGFDVADPEL